MTQSVKDRILSAAIGGGFSLIVALLVSFTAFKRDGNVQVVKDVEKLKVQKADKDELNVKVDKTTFTEFKEDHEKKHEAEIKYIIMHFDDKVEGLEKHIDKRIDDLKRSR